MFKHKTFTDIVRENVALQLVSSGTYDLQNAREAVYGLDDDTIAEAATTAAGASAPAPGSLLAMLLAFISSPAFASLIATLLSLFGGGVVAAANSNASGS